MNARQAKEIVESLSNGVDQETGEVYPPDSPYQRAHINRIQLSRRNGWRCARRPLERHLKDSTADYRRPSPTRPR